MLKLSGLLSVGAMTMCVALSTTAFANGVLPETSVVIVEQGDGEGSINVKNTEKYPLLLLTTLKNIEEDTETLLTVTPPAARVEAGKTQRVRFMVTSKAPLKTERLKRVVFEGVPPQEKGKNVVRVNVRQNLPVVIRPAGLARDPEPWKKLTWKREGDQLVVSNPSPYVVRLGQGIQTLPDNIAWKLPNTYILPNQSFTLSPDAGKKAGNIQKVRISPATMWGFTVDYYDAPLNQ